MTPFWPAAQNLEFIYMQSSAQNLICMERSKNLESQAKHVCFCDILVCVLCAHVQCVYIFSFVCILQVRTAKTLQDVSFCTLWIFHSFWLLLKQGPVSWDHLGKKGTEEVVYPRSGEQELCSDLAFKASYFQEIWYEPIFENGKNTEYGQGEKKIWKK